MGSEMCIRDSAYIRGGGEIPRVTTFGAYPGSSDLGSSKFAQKVRGDR